MTYAGLTREDRSRIKRWVHRRRFSDALRLASAGGEPRLIIDYGGGDGAFARLAAERFPLARVLCFEPVGVLRREAQLALAGSRVELVAEESGLPGGAADHLFCLEVLEHLPDPELQAALAHIRRVLAPAGRLILGVPVEVGPPALAKGLFRMVRRYGDFDSGAGRVLAAAAGRPPSRRPPHEIFGERAYFIHHLGFDHRRLLERLRAEFEVERLEGSPWPRLPWWLNSELYVVARARQETRMSHAVRLDRPADKAARYAEVAEEIAAVLEGEPNLTARMATVASMLNDAFESYFWTGFYVVDPDTADELVVGPYQGTLGCLRIRFGRGVCGTAAAERKTQIVEDVSAFPGHIACDSRSNSEIVVPVSDGEGRLIAVFDVDSTEFAAFDAVDAEHLERILARTFAG